MITKVVIENFRSHKNTTLEFVPGVNVIIGLTDSGKSAIFQAINWVISNRPLGNDFRSEWGGDTKVDLYTNEGNVVSRVRTATRNEYIVNGSVLKAFGTEPPEEVAQILHIEPENIQGQFDSYFLLASTPGEAAKQLNKAASIDDIDHVTSSLKSAYGKINNEVETGKKELGRLCAQLGQYDNLPDLERKLQWIETFEVNMQGAQIRITALKELARHIKQVDKELKETKDIPILLQMVESSQKLYESTIDQDNNLSKLKVIVSKIKQTRAGLDRTEQVSFLLQKLGSVQQLFDSAGEQSDSLSKLKGIVRIAKGNKLQLTQIDKAIEELAGEFSQLSPETCPLCGNLMKGM